MYKHKSIKQTTIGILFILPLFTILTLFIYFGIIYNIYISLFNWNGISEKVFIGLGNYRMLLQDGLFFNALKHTFLFMIICIPSCMVLGLFFSILLHSMKRGQNLYKSIFFIPFVLATVTVGITFKQFYDANFGMLNNILKSLGLESFTRSWLGEPQTALISLAVVYIFSHVGFYMLIYYTNMLSIDKELFEASRIDGATFIDQIRNIIVPLLSKTHIILLILGIIASLKVFDIVWVMTEGGPAGSTELLSTFLFRKALLEFKTGYSSAISVILLMIAAIYTAIQLYLYNIIRR